MKLNDFIMLVSLVIFSRHKTEYNVTLDVQILQVADVWWFVIVQFNYVKTTDILRISEYILSDMS